MTWTIIDHNSIGNQIISANAPADSEPIAY